MKLKEKFENVIVFTEIEGCSKQVDECVAIADNYAEEFGKWLRENDDESLLMSELLEIFIKEREL